MSNVSVSMRFPGSFPGIMVAMVAAVLSYVSSAAGQQPVADPVAFQRQAMQKLSFLVGRWSGPLTVVRGPGEPLHLTQAEEVQYKLDGLVLQIEGASRDAQGKNEFSALATVAYDDATHTYRFRAYNGGHYIDTGLTVTEGGFSWGYDAGPAHIVNTMHVTGKGEWAETTDVTVGSNPARRSVDMLLQRQP